MYTCTIVYHTVRLVGGSMPSEGRVEIFANGYWGTVCDDGWDQADARVVCRQLGFSDSLEATTESRFGRGTGEILLDDVACTESDNELVECSHIGIGMHNCNHGEDAGVVCNGVAGMLLNLFIWHLVCSEMCSSSLKIALWNQFTWKTNTVSVSFRSIPVHQLKLHVSCWPNCILHFSMGTKFQTIFLRNKPFLF